MMTKRMCAVCLLGLFALTTCASVAESKREAVVRQADEEKMLQMKDALQRQDAKISFFGKVMDQQNAPVQGATVSVHVTYFSPDAEKLFGATKAIQRITDGQGSFSVEEEKGRSLYIDSIILEGYEIATLVNTQRSFKYYEHGDTKPFIADRTSPVVFRLRKQGNIIFCLETKYWHCQISTSETGIAKGYDFVQQEPVCDLTKTSLSGKPLACDLLLRATFSTNDASWTIVLSPGTTNGGIIVSEQFLYEAPDDGYQSEYTFKPEDRKPVKANYVYLKSREPSIYTRLDLDGFNANKMVLRLNGKSAITNPYGDRSFERATDLPYEVTEQLADDAKSAFRQGKRPMKPERGKLIKDAKDKGKQ